MSTTKPAWGGVGAWALDAERAEEEEEHDQIPSSTPTPDSSQNFPSLREAAASAGKSKKKKQTFSLAEFTTGAYNKGPVADELLRLPTGPRERSAEELDRSRLGGGFRNFGGDGFRRREGSDEDSRRGPSQSRASEYDQPSRADEADNWARDKKSLTPSMSESGRRDRYGSLGTAAGAGTGFSRADETDSWSRDKKPISSSSSNTTSRYSGFGSGFRESAGSSDSDRWGRSGSLQNGDRERPRLVLEPPKRAEGSTPAGEVTRSRPSPFGIARPREEVLKEKGLDWRRMDTEIEHKGSRPTSSHSSRPSSAQSSRPGSPGSLTGDVAPRVRPKVNPFGDAKPREVVLEEKGKDWRKIDLELEHKGVDRAEMAEEKMLKEEIRCMKAELTETEQKEHHPEEEVKDLENRILEMEAELERLTVELDSKVRFGQRSSGDSRPGSGAGRAPVHQVQPEESGERPRSGGSSRGDPWARPLEENKWGFQGPRSRGPFADTSDRLSSKDKW